MGDWYKKAMKRADEREAARIKERQEFSKSLAKDEKDDEEIDTPVTRQPIRKQKVNNDKRVQLGTREERGVMEPERDKLGKFFTGTGKQLEGGYMSAGGTVLQNDKARDTLNRITTSTGDPMQDAAKNLSGMIVNRIKGDEYVKAREEEKKTVDNALDTMGRKAITQADRLIQSGTEDIEYVKKDMGAVGKFAVDVGSQGLMMGADALLSMVAPGLGQASFAARAGGMGAHEARQEGATEDQQLLYGAATGLMELGLEKLFSAGKYLKGMYGQGALDMATPMASRVATSNLVKGIVKSPQGQELVYQLTKAGFAMNEEGIEEALADLISPLLKRAVYADEIDMPSMGEVMYDYLVGAASGGLFGAAGTVADYKSGVGRMNQMQENGTMVEDMINRASVQGEKTSAGQFAQQLSAQRDSGKEVLGGQLNDLQRMTAPEQLKHETELMRQKEEADRKRMAGDVSKFNRTGTERENRAIVEISSGFVKDKVSDVEKIVAENADLSVTLSGDSATFEAVAKVATGTATAEDIDRILMKPAAKALVKEYTGVSLPVENTAARKSLENLVVFTGAEHRADIVTKAKAKIAEDMASSLGARGSAKFTEMYPKVNDQDNEKFYTVFKRFYNAGEYSMPIETVSKLVDDMGGEYQEVVSRYFTPEVRTAIHKAGFADSKVETAKNEERVIRHENIADRAKKGTFEDHTTGEHSKVLKESLKALAKRTGVNIIFVDTLGDSNGIYDNGTIDLAADADNPLITVAKHELTHYLKQYAPKEYQELEDYVFGELNNNTEIEKKIEQKIKQYARKGHHLTRSAAKEEILADMAEAFFTDESAIDRVIAYSKELGEAILDGIRSILDTFLAIADADTNKNSREYGRILDEIGILRDAERLWMKALQASLKNDVGYSIKDSGEITYDTLVNKKDMEIVQMDSNPVGTKDRKVIRNRARANAEKHGGKDVHGRLFVHVDDVASNVIVGGDAIIHGFARDYETKAKIALQIGEYLKNAIKVNEIKPRRKEAVGGYVLLGYGRNDAGEHFPAYFVVETLKGGEQELIDYDTLYSFNGKKIAGAVGTANRGFKAPTPAKISIAELLDIVNEPFSDILPKSVADHYGIERRHTKLGEDVKYSLKDSEGRDLSPAQQKYFAKSKVRDEDGNLRVVYHGSAENFTVFDRTKGRANMDIQGMFFSPWEDDAMGYGENVQAYYLDIKNPAPESVGYKALRKFQGQNNAGVKAREYLESLGYDGVNNGDEEYIAFHSNQIKLTSNQNPTKNDDVRYSMKEEDWLDDDEILLEYEEELLKGFAFPSIQDIMDTLKENIRAAEEAEKPKPRYREKSKEKGMEAKLTDERIDALFEKYGASTPTYAQAYITAIHPRDFLSLTLPDSEFEAWDGYVREGGHKAFYALDLEALKAQPQTPFLEIDEKTGRVTGHEGRHRMRALLDAGVTSVPIAVVDYRTKYTKEYKKYQELSAQQWDLDDGPINDNAHATVLDLIPINAANREDIMMMYGGKGDIKFSIKDEVTTTESGTVSKHSLKSWNDTDKAKLLKALTKAGYSKEDAEKWMDDVNSIAAIIAADRDRLDYTPDEHQQMLRNNDEYYRTLDASTLCKKRLLYQGTYNAIQHLLPNTPLLPEDVIRIRQIMDEAGYEVPCGICYEESRKKHEGKFAERWLSEYTGDYIPTLDQVTTTDGRAWLRRNHPEVLESYLAYQRTRGSANPKVSMTRTDYRGDILNLHPTTIKNIKHIGGLRIQSFSDFETPHLIDMMQAIMDMSAKKLTSQAYTKVPAFARVFGGTGVKINLSLIGQVDKTGKLVFDDKEGMPHQEAFEIREMYPDNVGTILVGANEESILAAWADDRIDMVIPFHRSGWSFDEMERLGLGGYEDFTEYQSEKYLDDERGPISFKAYKDIYGKKMEGLYSDDYWDFSKTGKENAEAYLKLCAEQKRVPVFSNFLVDNGDGSWSLQPDGSTDGYWKSLIDFKMYDNDGVGVPQKLVQPNFNMEEARKILEEYDEDSDNLPVADDIVERFVAEYKVNNPRAKYQLKEGPSYDRKVKTLEERVAYLKSEMKTGLKAPVEKDTKVQASKLLKKYDSNMVLHTKLVDTMKDIFKIYKTADGDWHEAYDKAEKMARRIVDKIAILHDESWQEYKELREHLKKAPITISEADKKAMGNYEDFRKANFGRMKLVHGEKSTVSDFYSKLAEKWPEKFTDDYTNPTDQLHHIEDVLDSLAPWYEHYSSRQMQGLVTEIAEDIMVTTGELATRKTFADRKAEEKERAVDRVKRQRDEAMERMKERYEEKLIRQKKTSKEKMDAYKEKQKDKASRKKAMDRIETNFKWLRERLLNPSDVSHIPEGYRAAVAELLEGFDFETDRTDAYEAKNGASKRVIGFRAFKDKFRQFAESQKDEEFVEIDPDFMAYMDEITDQIDGRRLSELDTVTLDHVSRLLKKLAHQVSYINRCFNDDIRETIAQLGDETIRQADSLKEAKNHITLLNPLIELMDEANVTPSDMFEMVGGVQQKLYQAMRNGFDRHVQNLQSAIQYTQATVKESKVKQWTEEKHVFTLEDGKVEMTTTQLMSLYVLMQRKQASEHILGSGIVIAPLEIKLGKFGLKRKLAETHVMLTLEEVLRMTGTLTAEQRDAADKLRDFMNGECSEWGNRTSMKLYGYQKFTEKNYFPIQSSQMFLNENFDKKNVESSLKNMGFTKALVKGANNPIVIDDIFTVFTNHVNKMSMYEALVPAMTDFQRVYNYKQKADSKQTNSVQKALRRAYGQQTVDYIKRFMEDVNGNQQRQNNAEIVSPLIARYKKASIGANLRVFVQQPTAIVRAWAIMNPKYFIAADVPKKSDTEEMQKYCPIARWKSYGFYNTDAARDMRDIMTGEKKLSDKIFMGAYGWADDKTWTVIWKAVKREVETEHPDLKKGSDEYWQKVNERASYVFDRTQVVDSVFHRSEIMRNKDVFSKMVTSFMAEPTKTFNLLRTEIISARREFSAGDKTASAKRMSRITAVFFLNAITVSVAAGLVDALRGTGGDDEEDQGDYWQRWYAYSKSNTVDNINPLNMIPYVKDAVSMFNGYKVERQDTLAFSKLINVARKWQKIITGESKYTAQVTRETAEAFSYLTGIPLRNVLRDVEAIKKKVEETVDTINNK